MFSNLSSVIDSSTFYPSTDSGLSFADYIQQCQAIISERRKDLDGHPVPAQTIIQANSPCEFFPENTSKVKTGVLLVHGLLDCPFSLRELGVHLQQHGILSRSILLPGHGTRPEDLLHVNYQQWQNAVRYGVETLKKEVDQVYLLGFSTGSALSICHAVNDPDIAGMILLAPVLKLRAPVDIGANWHHMSNYFGKNRNWVYNIPEDDYVKYKSIAFNAVKQVVELSRHTRNITAAKPVSTRMLLILSRDDETISSRQAVDFFTTQHNPRNKMILYMPGHQQFSDTRIETRNSAYPDANIASLSHPAITYSSANPHYGQYGDYEFASHLNQPYIYGAYNRIEMNVFDMLKKCGLTKQSRRVLTYNPDFYRMADNIVQYINGEF